jgi:hypothetical protein
MKSTPAPTGIFSDAYHHFIPNLDELKCRRFLLFQTWLKRDSNPGTFTQRMKQNAAFLSK